MTEMLDFVIIFLMVVAIIYGFILNRKIVLIQNSKKELANLFKSFDNTILKAQTGIDDLNKVSNEVSQLLQKKLDKAVLLIDDLAFLTEKAAAVSADVDKVVSVSKKGTVNIKAEDKVYNAEVIKSLRQAPEKQKISGPVSSSQVNVNNAKKTKMLETMLEKISEKRASKERTSNDNAYTTADARKQDKMSEKAVADMLKAMGYGE